MSIDRLQDRIRKVKNPTMLELSLSLSQLPPSYHPDLSAPERYASYCADILEALKGKLWAVRFGFASFALLGPKGLEKLSELLRQASKLGYYVALDAPGILSAQDAQLTAEALFGEDSLFPCDGVVVPAYPGSDVWKPFLPYCQSGKKDLFVAVRTATRSAPELQDLVTGSRLVHMAAADQVNRYGGELVGKMGYSSVSVLASAPSAESLRAIRAKYPRLFILVDGYDLPGGNAKNCAAAFDKLGHGAAVCAGTSITRAWARDEGTGEDALEQAIAAADRIKKNIGRYITVL